eukprot:scaffold867_cov317-Pavlova_lutheri.AAC.25
MDPSGSGQACWEGACEPRNVRRARADARLYHAMANPFLVLTDPRRRGSLPRHPSPSSACPATPEENLLEHPGPDPCLRVRKVKRRV